MRIHCLENVDKSLTFLNEMRVHLENMGAHDIVDGNPRLTLGLIWTIILRFQVCWTYFRFWALWKSLLYDSVDSGNGVVSGRGRAYWIFIFWTGKFGFSLTSNISAAEQGTAKKIAVQKSTIEFYSLLEFALPTVRRSAARGPKRKTFSPKFLENPMADRRNFCTVDRAHVSDKSTGICPSSFLWLGGGVSPKMTFLYLKNWSNDPPILFQQSKPRLIWWKTVKKNLGVLVDFLKFWGFEKFRRHFPPFFGGPPPKFLTPPKTFRNGIWWCQN